MLKSKPEILFHYTNFVALEGILLGKGIRLCCANEMNDKLEVMHFIQMLEMAVLKRCETENRKDLISSAKTIFNEERNERKNEVVYLVSFTEWEDDAAQWERYGNGGYGVSVAFDYNALEIIRADDYLMCNGIHYGKNADSHQLVDDIYDVLKGKFSTTHNFDKKEAVFGNAWECAASFKNPSFMSEREYRVLTQPTWKGKRFDKLGDLQTVTVPAQIKKCLYFDWKKRCKEKHIPIATLIKRIVVGPKSPQNIEDLREWLRNNGLGELSGCVVKSESSLR